MPGFEAVVPFEAGVARSVAWFEANPEKQVVDRERDAALDRIVDAYGADRVRRAPAT